MHPEAMAWVAQHATTDPVAVLDIGGRFINGSPRVLFPAAEYVVLDVMAGPGVDIVADAATWEPDRVYDVVVCAEVFEHAREWSAICRTAFEACSPGGSLIVTCAGPGRAVHSGIDGSPNLHPGEHYENVPPDALADALTASGWRDVIVDQSGLDVRAVAWK